MKQLFSSILTLALVAGCAATPPAKPQLPDEMYDWAARNSHDIGWCVTQGLMAPETGGWGQAYVSTLLANSTYDAQRLAARSRVIEQSHYTIPPSHCSTLAMQISELRARQPVARQSSGGGGGGRTWQDGPQFTTCNRVFGQVNCTTY